MSQQSDRDARASSLLNLLHHPSPSVADSDPHASPVAPPAASISVDSLFRSINTPSDTSSAPQQLPQHQTPPPPSSINSERQNALLSLLGNVGSPQQLPASQSQPNRQPPDVQQPLPSSQSETQGKLLLEQLMSGTVQTPSSEPLSGPASSRPTTPPEPTDATPTAGASNQTPARRPIFDYVSPYEAFSSPTSQPQTAAIRKPVPSIHPASVETSPRITEASSIPQQLRTVSQPGPGSHASSDVESHHSAPATHAERPANPSGRNYPGRQPHDAYDSSGGMNRNSPPPPPASISPQLYQGGPSPNEAAPIVAKSYERDPPPHESGAAVGTTKVNKREELRPQPAQGPPASTVSKAQPRSVSVAQEAPSPTFVLDVSTLLNPITAPSGLTAVTPIALLKLENVYSQGTTIAVSGFIAYAMTRGRVRLIARSNGSRALLHLPAPFPTSTSATDMVVNNNLLACVTSDGGLVVWDVPAELDDNPPVELLLHIGATEGAYGLKLVKWHPKQPGMMAVASDMLVYFFNVNEAKHLFRREETSLAELAKISKVFKVPSPLVSFTFDSPNIALATLSIDSTITLWSIREEKPFWSGRVPGEGLPSSLDFLDGGGLLVGRKQGTILQLLPIMSARVASTIKFTNGAGTSPVEDESIFCHFGYDPRIRTLWIAHSARPSLFAVRVSFSPVPFTPTSNTITQAQSDPYDSNRILSPTSGTTVTPVIDQIAQFPTPMQCINMAILVSDEPDATTAVASFAMHQGGVDQVNIPMEVFENALTQVDVRLPAATYSSSLAPSAPSPLPPAEVSSRVGAQGQHPQQQQQQSAQQGSRRPRATVATPPSSSAFPPLRPRSPLEADSVSGKKTGKGKKEERDKTKAIASAGATSADVKPEVKVEEGTSSTSLPKDLRKVEDNLHLRFSKTLTKELDKQHARIDELRRADQAHDVARQEMLISVISEQLTKNTTHLVEKAIKQEVQVTVLPALENIARSEIKNALNSQIAKGLSDSMQKALPNEIERLLLRPDVSSHVARTFSSTVTPLVERHVKDAITKTLIPAYQSAASSMQLELSREISSEMVGLKKEIVTWQSEALRGTEAVIREMEQTIRGLSDQVRTLSLQIQPQPSSGNLASVSHRSSPIAASIQHQNNSQLQHPHPQSHLSTSSHLRQGNLASLGGPSSLSSMLVSQQAPLLPPSSQQPPQQSMYGAPSGMWSQPSAPIHHQQPYVQSPIGSQQSVPTSFKPVPPPSLVQKNPQPPIGGGPSRGMEPPVSHQAPPTRNEDWDDTFLSVLGKQDHRSLRELLTRANPEVIMPSNGEQPAVSQAVILTLIHRLSESLAELNPMDESFRVALWWMQRAAYSVDPNDSVIVQFVGPVTTTAQGNLSTTAQRINGSNGNPSYPELQNTIMAIQNSLDSLTRFRK